MKYKGGSIIKNLRSNMGISQEELAKRLHISQRELSRVESGKKELDWLEFILAFGALGHFSDNFWIMYLDYEEFTDYLQYQSIRKHFANNRLAEARDEFSKFRESQLAKHDFMRQFTMACGFILGAMDDDRRMQGLYDALNISIFGFDVTKIESYGFNYNEIIIVNELALVHSRLGNAEIAIDMLQGIAVGLESKRLRISHQEKEMIFPAPLVNLFRLLVQTNRYDEAVNICRIALDIGRELYIFHFHPETTFALAISLMHTGKPQDEYLPLLVRAYHGACGIGQTELAAKIKEAYYEVIGQ